MFLATSIFAVPTTSKASGATITVDFSNDHGSPQRLCSGFLFTVSNKDSENNHDLLMALKPDNWRLRMNNDPNSSFSGDAPALYNLLKNTYGVSTIQVVCSDKFLIDADNANIPRSSLTLDGFKTSCVNQAQVAKNNGQTYDWDIINEANIGGSDPIGWWIEGAKSIRSVIPNAVLEGFSAGYSPGNCNDLMNFLGRTQAAGVYPDKVTWHFSTSTNLENDVNNVRQAMINNGYPARPIVINEIMESYQTNSLDSPGINLAFLAAAQRANVHTNYAIWGEDNYPVINHLLYKVSGGSKFGGYNYYTKDRYYVQKEYVNMSGSMVQTTTSDISQVDGLACKDTSKRTATVLIGAVDQATPGSFTLMLNKLSSASYLVNGSTVTVKIEKCSINAGGVGYKNATTSTYNVTNDSVSIPISIDQYQSVKVTVNDLTPSGQGVPGKIEAESFDSMSGIQNEDTTDIGGGLNVGSVHTGSWMDYNVNVPTAGTYTVDFRVASLNGGGQIQLKKFDGTVLLTKNIAATGGWQAWTTVSGSFNLVAGVQRLRVYASAAGWNLNWLNFSSSNTINDNDSGITYSGGSWGYASRGLGDYNDDVHYATNNNDYAQYTFNGTGIDYITEKNSDQGDVHVYIDGALQQTVSCNNSSRLVQQTVYSKTGLASGSHTIKLVKSTGTYMLVDAFNVR